MTMSKSMPNTGLEVESFPFKNATGGMSMTDIKETLESLKTSSEVLQESSNQIARLTSSIDEFANQANLLALNAMIEVARVGKNGKALSDLAEEISTLASKSAGVAQGISEIVKTVRDNNPDE